MEETYKREIHAKNDQISALQRQVQELQNVSQMLRGKLEQVEAHSAVCRNNLRPTMVQYAAQERKQLRKQLYEEQYQIGYVMVQPSMAIGDAGGFTEVWVWGQRYKDIMAMQLSAKKKSDVSQQNKLLEELERDKSVFLKDLRRAYDEDRSKYNTVDVLLDRYVLYWLLGRGGFSEVWKAYDTITCEFVAVKVHHANPDWPEERRRSYIRHARREYEVHMNLAHPRVVTLREVHVLDDRATFFSVMEYSAGVDLDTFLKKHGVMVEKEAKVVVTQLVQGLRYLAEQNVIHYDLKPANILFTHPHAPASLDIKITDFGLCKVISDEAMHGEGNVKEIELTSQGTGTYWYLPPECFGTSGDIMSAAPTTTATTPTTSTTQKISTKVDVWALGVVFFQLLYGKRPFGEGMSQKQIWYSGIMTKVKEVEFPAKPVVSTEAKEFIKKCLNPLVAERPSIAELSMDAYVGGGEDTGTTTTSSRSKRDRGGGGVSAPPPANAS